MASAIRVIGGKGSSTWIHVKEKGNRKKMNTRVRICSCNSSSVMDPYRTLRIQPNASESEIKKAFRQLVLQYHPDVCRGNNCEVQFQTINEAYDIVMSKMREGPNEAEMYEYDEGFDESELWEEWMGWEGAGIRDYTSHINPYI